MFLFTVKCDTKRCWLACLRECGQKERASSLYCVVCSTQTKPKSGVSSVCRCSFYSDCCSPQWPRPRLSRRSADLDSAQSHNQVHQPWPHTPTQLHVKILSAYVPLKAKTIPTIINIFIIIFKTWRVRGNRGKVLRLKSREGCWVCGWPVSLALKKATVKVVWSKRDQLCQWSVT